MKVVVSPNPTIPDVSVSYAGMVQHQGIYKQAENQNYTFISYRGSVFVLESDDYFNVSHKPTWEKYKFVKMPAGTEINVKFISE